MRGRLHVWRLVINMTAERSVESEYNQPLVYVCLESFTHTDPNCPRAIRARGVLPVRRLSEIGHMECFYCGPGPDIDTEATDRFLSGRELAKGNRNDDESWNAGLRKLEADQRRRYRDECEDEEPPFVVEVRERKQRSRFGRWVRSAPTKAEVGCWLVAMGVVTGLVALSLGAL